MADDQIAISISGASKTYDGGASHSNVGSWRISDLPDRRPEWHTWRTLRTCEVHPEENESALSSDWT
jgi:hypothetical protein